MAAVYGLAQTVATNATPPSSITTDPNVGAFYSTAPAQKSVPQYFLAINGIEGGKQEPRYIGAGRTEEFEVLGAAWGGVADPSPTNLETLCQFLGELITSLDTSIDADPTLGGNVVQSWLATYDLEFDTEQQGRAAFITFTIHCEALTS